MLPKSVRTVCVENLQRFLKFYSDFFRESVVIRNKSKMKKRINVLIVLLAILWTPSSEGAPLEKDTDNIEALKSDQTNVKLPFSLELEPPPIGTGKLVSKQYKDSVVFPDEVTRDSYGNLTPPFEVPRSIIPSVDETDNGERPALKNGQSNKPRVVLKAGLQFQIPSYASGIMSISKPQLDLLPPPLRNGAGIEKPSNDFLPPLSSGNYNFPGTSQDQSVNEIRKSLSTTPKTSFQNVISPAEDVKLAGRLGEEIFDAPVLTVTLLPPVADETPQLANTPEVIVNIKSPNFPVTPSSKSINPFGQIPNQESTIPIQTPTNILFFPSPGKPAEPVKPNGQLGIPSTAPSQPFNVAPGKYTGGFGGAPGVLGEQKQPGYAVKPDGTIRDPDYQRPKNPSASVPPVIPVAPVVKPSILPPNAGMKYTGGFGGPPGFLSPYDG